MSAIVRPTPRVTAPPGFAPDKGGLHRGGDFVWHGAGEENLIRDAAMDTDTDGDGVVDGFGTADSTGVATFSLNGTDGSQQITVDSSGASQFNRAAAIQRVLRVFPGDEIIASVEGRIQNATDGKWEIRFSWRNEAGGQESADANSFTSTSFSRESLTATAPANTAYVEVWFGLIVTADDGQGTVDVRDARLLRASSDPATYANPHVDGASQTGASLATAGWPANEDNVVRKGDAFIAGGSGVTQGGADAFSHIYRAASDVSSNASGEATIPLGRSLLASPADGAALRFNPPR